MTEDGLSSLVLEQKGTLRGHALSGCIVFFDLSIDQKYFPECEEVVPARDIEGRWYGLERDEWSDWHINFRYSTVDGQEVPTTFDQFFVISPSDQSDASVILRYIVGDPDSYNYIDFIRENDAP